MITRREWLGFLTTLGLAASSTASATLRGTGRAGFSRNTVIERARELASRPFQPADPAPRALAELDANTYRAIRYRKAMSIWSDSPTKFNVELFAPGFVYRQLVDVAVVENGTAYDLTVTRDSFDLPTPELQGPLLEAGRFAGFRLHYPLEQPDRRDEFLGFQGASYFHGASAGQIYGLSARGLAIDVAEPHGEEHPFFRRFWIERPSVDHDSMVVHALLDSPGVTGAYRFGIYPGAPLRLEVEVALFPRRDLHHVGLAPLNSMFLHGTLRSVEEAPALLDYRPTVHDSQGLVVHNGNGERIWRSLANPETLQISAFVDHGPRGFGLIQRDRRFSRFEDLTGRFHRRPSAWVQPLDDWGEGAVQLIEIPSDSERNDNIIAYWRPRAPLRQGVRFDYRYRLTWPDDAPVASAAAGTRPSPPARVLQAIGGRTGTGPGRQIRIDYTGAGELDMAGLTVDAWISRGRILQVHVKPNPHVQGFRVLLAFEPPEADTAELRVQPLYQNAPYGETWLYRWTGS